MGIFVFLIMTVGTAHPTGSSEISENCRVGCAHRIRAFESSWPMFLFWIKLAFFLASGLRSYETSRIQIRTSIDNNRGKNAAPTISGEQSRIIRQNTFFRWSLYLNFLTTKHTNNTNIFIFFFRVFRGSLRSMFDVWYSTCPTCQDSNVSSIQQIDSWTYAATLNAK